MYWHASAAAQTQPIAGRQPLVIALGLDASARQHHECFSAIYQQFFLFDPITVVIAKIFMAHAVEHLVDARY